MAKKRKTVEVFPLMEWLNRQLARTDDFATIEFKEGIIAAAEKILHNANQYNGFYFIDNTDIKVNSPGYYKRVYM
jgi:hypothetical protein